MIIAWFVGSRKNDDLKFSGYYLMRDDKRAVVPHETHSRPLWMQFVKRDEDGGWLPLTLHQKKNSRVWCRRQSNGGTHRANRVSSRCLIC